MSKNRIYIIISFILILITILFFSTIFAILNLGKTTFVKGTKIKNIDISNLTGEEAKKKITEAMNIELMSNINLKYNDEYEINFQADQIEFTYNISSAINEAYNIGRNKDIIENNYEILSTAFFGKNIEPEYTYNEQLLDDFVGDISAKLPNLVIEPTYYIEEEFLIINKGTDGIKVEKEKLKETIIDSINMKNAEALLTDNSSEIIEIPVIQTKAEKIDIQKIYNEVYKLPKDAYYTENPFKIFVEVNGIDFNISLKEAREIIGSGNEDEYTIPLKFDRPEKTISDIGKEAFPYLISSFTTQYDTKNINRTENLEIATEKINGTVLMPGDVFSFNQTVGKRTVEEGYKDAKVFQNGQVVDGLAGGICQISSTLYNAALLANLQIKERRNHTFKPSYVSIGRDATVVYGTTDFQFINTRQSPIKIEATVGTGMVEFRIIGLQEEIEYEVKILPTIIQSIPYETQYIHDATLPPGTEALVQTGAPGCKSTTYKELRLNGEVVLKGVLSNDIYSPLNSIIRVGP